jgi:hypothetical protein
LGQRTSFDNTFSLLCNTLTCRIEILLDVEVLLVRVGLEEGIEALGEWVQEGEVASGPISSGSDLSSGTTRSI